MTGLIGTLAVGLLLGIGGREGSAADAGTPLARRQVRWDEHP
jgi:hypothetical protein